MLFSALGTTIRAAGSREAQYRVDHGYQYRVAEAARRNGVRTLVLVSAAGASPASRIFYSRMKGELERDVEALGFERSALRTKRAALDGIARCKHPGSFALLHDTFHHYLSGEQELFPKQTGLVHVSGVPAGKPRPAIEDDDRVLVDASDVMDSRGQVAALLAGGCTAPISFEPFSPAVRALPVPELKAAIQRSVTYLLA